MSAASAAIRRGGGDVFNEVKHQVARFPCTLEGRASPPWREDGLQALLSRQRALRSIWGFCCSTHFCQHLSVTTERDSVFFMSNGFIAVAVIFFVRTYYAVFKRHVLLCRVSIFNDFRLFFSCQCRDDTGICLWLKIGLHTPLERLYKRNSSPIYLCWYSLYSATKYAL